MAENNVAVREQGFISDVSPDRWAMMLSQAETIVKAKLCPAADTKETVVVKILAGREYGLSAMQSLRALYVVGQKVAMMSDTVAGLVFQRLPGAKIDCIETTDKIATFRASRPGGEPVTLSFTMEDAKRANLTGGTSWTKYPAQMLRARCQIAICRLVFPDVCAGLYTPDELGDKDAHLGDRVPFGVQMAAERERLAKKELQDAGLLAGSRPIDAEVTEKTGDGTLPLTGEDNQQGEPPEEPTGRVECTKQGTTEEKQTQILEWAQEMTDADPNQMEALFVIWGSFIPTKTKDGKFIPEEKRKVVPGKKNVFDYTGKWLDGVLDKAQTAVYAYREGKQ